MYIIDCRYTALAKAPRRVLIVLQFEPIYYAAHNLNRNVMAILEKKTEL